MLRAWLQQREGGRTGCIGRLQVILLKDIPGTGSKGELARVNNGYLRNYLMPQQLAVPATAGILQCVFCCRWPLPPCRPNTEGALALSMPIVVGVCCVPAAVYFAFQTCVVGALLRAPLHI